MLTLCLNPIDSIHCDIYWYVQDNETLCDNDFFSSITSKLRLNYYKSLSSIPYTGTHYETFSLTIT